MKKRQTFQERIEDESKTPLYKLFVQWVYEIAKANGKTVDEIWTKYQDYCQACTNSDQSPMTSEFLDWNKLAGMRMEDYQ